MARIDRTGMLQPGFYWARWRVDGQARVAEWDGARWFWPGISLDRAPFEILSERLAAPDAVAGGESAGVTVAADSDGAAA